MKILVTDDPRPPFILEDVKGISFLNVKATHIEGVPTFILKNVTDFSIINSESLPDKKISNTTDLKH